MTATESNNSSTTEETVEAALGLPQTDGEISSTDEGLTDDERGILKSFEDKRKGSSDKDKAQDDEVETTVVSGDGPDGATAPGDEPDPTSGQEAGTAGASVSPTSDPDTSIPATFRLGEREVSADEIAAAFSTHDWITNLPQPDKEYLAAAMSGQFALIPLAEMEQYEAFKSGGTTTSASSSTQDDDLDDYADPKARQEIERLRGLVEQTSRTTQDTQAVLMEQAQQERIATIRSVNEAFKADRGLSDAEITRLANTVASTGIANALVTQAGGDIKVGLTAALEQAYWADPELRERAITQAAAVAAEKAEADRREASEKKRKAGAVAGASGSVPRTPVVDKSPAGRRAAMAAAIAASRSESGQV